MIVHGTGLTSVLSSAASMIPAVGGRGLGEPSLVVAFAVVGGFFTTMSLQPSTDTPWMSFCDVYVPGDMSPGQWHSAGPSGHNVPQVQAYTPPAIEEQTSHDGTAYFLRNASIHRAGR